MSNITLTIPNDDTTALRHFGKALIEIASEKEGRPLDISTDVKEPEIDTTTQQVESLATVKPFEERLELLDKALSKETPESLVEKLQSYNPEPTTDSTGTPWDERIHSTSKALNADGTWRLRRKPKDMDEVEWSDYVSLIKADLQYPVECGGEPPVTPPGEALYAPENYVHMYRATDNIYALAKSDVELAEFEADGYVRHTQEQYDAWEGPNTVDEGDDHHTDTDVVTEQTVAGIPPIPVPPPVVVAPPVPEVTTWDFPRLMTFLTERHGKIDVATVNTLLAQDGMSSVQELNAHPDKIGPFVARVKAHLGE